MEDGEAGVSTCSILYLLSSILVTYRMTSYPTMKIAVSTSAWLIQVP